MTGLTCRDCATPLVYGGRGRYPRRCEPCRRRFYCEISKRWTAAHREHYEAYQRAYRERRRAERGEGA